MIPSLVRKLFQVLPVSWQIRLNKKVSLLYDQAGYGDTLMISAVAREIKKNYGDVHITVNRAQDELLAGNPNIDSTGNRFNGIDLNYHYGRFSVGRHFEKNIISVMCRKVGIRNVRHTVDLFLSPEETAWADAIIQDYSAPVITIHTTTDGFDNGRKLWPSPYWEQLVSMLRQGGYTVLQLGGSNDTPVKGAQHLHGTITIRQSIALMRNADLHIGIVSSLMHGAAAVNTPALILFGGFERFAIHGYSTIEPIESYISCSPCIEAHTKIGKCPFNTQCMREILPEAVFEKAVTLISKTSHTTLSAKVT